MPPTTAERDELVEAANSILELDSVTATHIDDWIDRIRWRWPTTMTVLEHRGEDAVELDV